MCQRIEIRLQIHVAYFNWGSRYMLTVICTYIYITINIIYKHKPIHQGSSCQWCNGDKTCLWYDFKWVWWWLRSIWYLYQEVNMSGQEISKCIKKILHSLWHSFWHPISHLFWHSFWLSIWHSLWHLAEVRPQLGSGNAHCCLSGARGWGPAVNWGAALPPLLSGAHGWGPAVPTRGWGAGGGEGGGQDVPLIKSRDPHLAGGEQNTTLRCEYTQPVGNEYTIMFTIQFHLYHIYICICTGICICIRIRICICIFTRVYANIV